jgi:hypothetical protein
MLSMGNSFQAMAGSAQAAHNPGPIAMVKTELEIYRKKETM